MERERTKWSDERMDDLSGRIDKFETRVDDRFNDVDRRLVELEARTDARFDRVETRLEAIDSTLHSIQRSMVVALAGILAAFGSAVLAIQL